jgi:hypothetical protein
MAEPIKPETLMATTAVAVPPPTTPVASEIVQKPVLTDYAAEYRDAADSGNPAKMLDFANKARGSEFYDAAVSAADIMNKQGQEFDSYIKPIMAKGGVNTPQGRLAIRDTWEAASQKPQIGRAIVETLLGNPNARLFVTGGTVKSSIKYDDAGNAIEQFTNELGRIVRATDLKTGREIGPREFSALQAGLDLDKTLGRKNATAIQEFNVGEFNKAEKASDSLAAAAPALTSLYANKQKMLEQLHGSGLNNKQLEELASFSSKQIGYTQSVTSGFNAMDQYVRSKGVGIDESTKKAAQSGFEKFGFKAGADGSVTDSNNVKVDKNYLDQLQKNFSKNNNFEQNYSQTKEDAIKSEVYKNLNAQQKQVFDSILENDRRIEAKNAELFNAHGTLPFLVNPAAMNIGDQFARAEVQAIFGQMNSEITALYNQWRKGQVEEFRKRGEVPSAGQLENAFAKTPQYEQLRLDYADLATKVRLRPVETAPEREAVSASPVAGLKPQAEINKVPSGTPPPAKTAATEPQSSPESRALLREKFRR